MVGARLLSGNWLGLLTAEVMSSVVGPLGLVTEGRARLLVGEVHELKGKLTVKMERGREQNGMALMRWRFGVCLLISKGHV